MSIELRYLEKDICAISGLNYTIANLLFATQLL
jgi:hypothetical protein